jgi:hypothetical protein
MPNALTVMHGRASPAVPVRPHLPGRAHFQAPEPDAHPERPVGKLNSWMKGKEPIPDLQIIKNKVNGRPLKGGFFVATIFSMRN